MIQLSPWLIPTEAGWSKERSGRASCAPCIFAMNLTATQEKSGFRPYPRQYETRARFAGHLNIFFRPIKPTDADLLREFFRSHSERTILYRYFTPLHDLPPELVQQFVNLDYHSDMAIVGMVPFEGRERMLCVGRYCRNPAANDAEIAITVHDQWQRHGIGTFFFKLLTRIARENEITGFTADVMADNHGMLRLIRKCVDNMESTLEAGVYHLWFALDNKTRAAQRHLKLGKKKASSFSDAFQRRD
jgi:acetyltransferase